MAQKRVVVTGYGVLTPSGKNANEMWQNLVNGVSSANEITRFDTTKFKTRFACEISNYDPADYFDKKESRKLDLFQQYALISCAEAVKQANLVIDKLDRSRCGVIWGSGIGGLETISIEISDFITGDGTPRFSPYFLTKILIDSISGLIATKYKFEGPNYATVSACSSSSNAIIDACNNIRLDKADLFIVGGSEAPICPVGIGAFNAIHALSTRNDEYWCASRPFDKDRDGFVIAEGAGALIIESLDHALARKAPIFAEILGTGLYNDIYHITSPNPEGDAAYHAMKEAVESSEISVSDIDHINTHGTSTIQGDIAELNAIKHLFGEHLPKVFITSTKSMTGHLLGAAGAVETVISVLTILNGIIPPTINHHTNDPDFDHNFNIVFNKCRKHKINCVINNSFGFGGHNTSIILKKYIEK